MTEGHSVRFTEKEGREEKSKGKKAKGYEEKGEKKEKPFTTSTPGDEFIRDSFSSQTFDKSGNPHPPSPLTQTRVNNDGPIKPPPISSIKLPKFIRPPPLPQPTCDYPDDYSHESSKFSPCAADDLRFFRLEPGERLNRTVAGEMCRRFFDNDARTNTELTAEQRQVLNSHAKRVLEKFSLTFDTRNDPIHIEIRSVPVKMYANVLRHFYVRVENVLEVHPGTNHTIALAWWHNTTQLATDMHERTLYVCGQCCDSLLDYLWSSNEKFNIIWRNCDQLLNCNKQTLIIFLLCVLMSWYTTFRDWFGLIVLIGTLIMVILIQKRWNERQYAIPDNMVTVQHCEHVSFPLNAITGGSSKPAITGGSGDGKPTTGNSDGKPATGNKPVETKKDG